jgi:threonine/homoserine/homoserine lactone efflux protein
MWRYGSTGMLNTLVTFLPIAALLTVTPGPATAMVVRSAARGGRRDALLTTVGNSLGVLAWACLAAAGVAAVVAASAAAFSTLKLVGAAFLVVRGARTLLGRRTAGTAEEPLAAAPLREGLLGGIANPKLGAFFVALFPQFVPHGEPVLGAALAMAALIVVADLIYFSALAYVVAGAKRALVDGPWLCRVERLTGAVLVGLGVRLALERR